MADMSEMLKNFASMMEGKDIPDNIKEMLNSLQNSSSEKMTINSNSDNNNNSSVNYNNNVNNDNNGVRPDLKVFICQQFF